jgi:hypothetical protein
MEVRQHRKLGHRRQAPRRGDKDDDVPAHYLGTNRKRTRGATASSKSDGRDSDEEKYLDGIVKSLSAGPRQTPLCTTTGHRSR